MVIGLIPVSIIFVVYTLVSIGIVFVFIQHERTEKQQQLQASQRQSKALTAVWDIEQIIVNNLEFGSIGGQIVQAILLELEQYGYVFVFLFMLDEKTNVLKKFSSARKKDLPDGPVLNAFFAEEIIIPLTHEQNPLVQSLTTKQMTMHEDFASIFGGYVGQTNSSQIQSTLGVQTCVAFPIAGKEKTFGSMLFGVAKKPQDISVYEIKMMQGFINAVNIALENSTLFAAVKQTTEKLRAANKQLQELDKLKDEFVSLASHELRTPMTAIRGSLSTIIDGFVGEINDKVREFLTAAYNENDRLIRLVNNLLNISRIEAGRFVFTITPIDLNKIIPEIVYNFQMAGNEKGITIQYQKTAELPVVQADEDKVREVFINLIGNAIKFTQKGGITITAKVEGDMIIASVTDTGSGIAKKDQELLFKKFSQIKGYSKQSGGTGLGLYISKKIIEGQGGKMWIDSEVGKGSTFHFSLPIHKQAVTNTTKQ